MASCFISARLNLRLLAADRGGAQGMKIKNPKPKTQNPKPKTQNPKPKTQNPKPQFEWATSCPPDKTHAAQCPLVIEPAG
jgi:hypothetical protein